jgi:hypothetical protein
MLVLLFAVVLMQVNKGGVARSGPPAGIEAIKGDVAN